MTVRETVEESPDRLRLGGVGYALQEDLKSHIRSEIRTTVLGHMQRGGTPTAFDRNLATIFGAYAGQMVAEVTFGRMVVLRDNRLGSVAFEEVANRTRTVPADHPLLMAGLSVGTSFGMKDMPYHLDTSVVD
jgi:ATP-dependent phosphofructokinase / diphosphate-dependent phosphofructokinase